MTDENELRERLAEYAHAAWSGWMEYMLGKCRPGTSRLDNGDTVENGTLVIPVDLVERWQRQMQTPYDALPESEKESDRAEADRMLAIFYGEQE